jgi:glyoxylase-like metal-dependent hydrolase (beta-lactamase superfamily II)
LDAQRGATETTFTPIREGVFRWSTPDPADDLMMVGHLFVRETGVVFVDPPMVPGLLEAASRLGKLEAVLLTEQNHTRGSRFIAKRAGIPVYLPETIPEAVEPWETARVKQIGDFEVYGAGTVLGFQAFKFGDDYALLSDRKELLVGDNARGDAEGNVLIFPEWFNLYTPGPPYPAPEDFPREFRDSLRKQFKDIVKTTGATTLLASHNFDMIGSLQTRTSGL